MALVLLFVSVLLALVAYLLIVHRPPLPSTSFLEVNKPCSLFSLLLNVLESKISVMPSNSEDDAMDLILNEKHIKNGRPFWIWIKRVPVLILFSPAHLKSFLSSGVESTMEKGIDYHVHKSFLGNSLLTSPTDSHWTSQRKLLTTIFNGKLMHQVANHTAQVAEKHFDGLLSSQQNQKRNSGGRITIDLVNEATIVFIKVAIDVLFGFNIDDHPEFQLSKIITWLQVLVAHMETKLQFVSLPMALDDPEFSSAKRELERFFNCIIGQRKKELTTSNFIDCLIANGADQQQLLDEMMTFLLVGHDASVSAFVFTTGLMLLPQHRSFLEETVKKLDNDDSTDEEGKNKWLEACVKEAMRLYPPAAIFGRRTTTNVTVDDVQLPPNTQVFLAPIITHKIAPSISNENDRRSFNPQRFLGDDGIKYSPEYCPFGIGPRNCIGMKFAMVEVRELLGYFLNRFPSAKLRPTVAKDTSLGGGIAMRTEVAGLVIRPQGGLWVDVFN